MKLDNLVTTYEQSKRIKELGFEKKSYFLREKEYDEWPRVVWPEILFWGYEKAAQYYHCFMAEELGEILPRAIPNKPNYHLQVNLWFSSNVHVAYYNYVKWRIWTSATWPTLAQAMGDMLIYLLENNLLPTNETDE